MTQHELNRVHQQLVWNRQLRLTLNMKTFGAAAAVALILTFVFTQESSAFPFLQVRLHYFGVFCRKVKGGTKRFSGGSGLATATCRDHLLPDGGSVKNKWYSQCGLPLLVHQTAKDKSEVTACKELKWNRVSKTMKAVLCYLPCSSSPVNQLTSSQWAAYSWDVGGLHVCIGWKPLSGAPLCCVSIIT